MGDAHGSLKSVQQVLSRAHYDDKKDRLIILGDICDGWGETKQLIDYLITLEDVILVLGNHDLWLIDWLYTGKTPQIWTTQGGEATIKSYQGCTEELKEKHKKFYARGLYVYVDVHARVYVHGGIDLKKSFLEQEKNYVVWDRELWHNRYHLDNTGQYKEIYVGHTSTWGWEKVPARHSNVWFMDQGGGFEGKLSLMDVDTKEFWQSDMVKDLYN